MKSRDLSDMNLRYSLINDIGSIIVSHRREEDAYGINIL